MALRWAEIDLDALEIRVERSWDVREGPVEPKSIAGTRVVPIAATLAAVLRDHRAATAWREGLVFGRSPGQPFNPGTVQQRARAAWSEAKVGALTLHEARHTFASLMIAAGVTPKALQTYLGHGSVAITLDRYGHLFPSDRGRDAAALGRAARARRHIYTCGAVGLVTSRAGGRARTAHRQCVTAARIAKRASLFPSSEPFCNPLSSDIAKDADISVSRWSGMAIPDSSRRPPACRAGALLATRGDHRLEMPVTVGFRLPERGTFGLAT